MIWWHMVRVSFMQCFLATRLRPASFPPLPSLYCYIFSTYFFHCDSYLFCFLLMGAHGWVTPLCQPWEQYSIYGAATSKSRWIPWTCTQPPNLHLAMQLFITLITLECILTCRMLIQIHLSVPYWGIKTSCLYDTSWSHSWNSSCFCFILLCSKGPIVLINLLDINFYCMHPRHWGFSSTNITKCYLGIEDMKQWNF